MPCELYTNQQKCKFGQQKTLYDAAHWTVKFAKCNVKAKLSRSILRLPQKTSKLLFLRTIFQN